MSTPPTSVHELLHMPEWAAAVCAQTNENNVCLSYYEHQCAGICSSESRLEPIFESCLKDPLNRLAALLAEQGETLEDQ